MFNEVTERFKKVPGEFWPEDRVKLQGRISLSGDRGTVVSFVNKWGEIQLIWDGDSGSVWIDQENLEHVH